MICACFLDEQIQAQRTEPSMLSLVPPAWKAGAGGLLDTRNPRLTWGHTVRCCLKEEMREKEREEGKEERKAGGREAVLKLICSVGLNTQV